MKLTLTLIFSLLALSAPPVAANVQSTPTAAARYCAEDDPCFRWYRDGNGDRGVYVHGRGDVRVIVGRRAFCRLSRQGRINWRITPRLRGDRAACNYWR